MAELVWTHRAKEDLEGLVEYIAAFAPFAAKRLVAKIFKRVERLRAHPLSGNLIAEDSLQRYREVLQGNQRIIYRIDGDTVYIVTIYHAARLLDENELT